MPQWIDIFDLILAPLYVILILGIALIIKVNKLRSPGNEHYKFLIPGLICKMIGGVSLCLIYTLYYKIGGDVTNYFLSATTYLNVLYDGNFSLFTDMLDFYNHNVHLTGFITKQYGQIHFMHTDHYALFTTVLSLPVIILGSKSFIASTLILSSLSFIGLWKMYEVFIIHFPALIKQLAIAMFFIPSVFFWGSGLLKDTYCIFAIGMYTFGIYKFMIAKERRIKYLIAFIGSSFLLIMIKPYILFALLPGSLLWINFNRIKRIQNPIVKMLSIPVLLTVLFLSVVFIFSVLGNYLGDYSLDNVLDKAVKTQKDLVREQYGTNFYDIGSFDASFGGILSKVPAALNMALFRPYLWDAANPVMLLSGLENMLILGFTIFIIIRVRIRTFLSALSSQPLFAFSLLFSLFFAFSVGLTTANYGALVRLKIPFVPFYIASLFIITHINEERERTKALNALRDPNAIPNP